MGDAVLACVDGSELSLQGVAAGLELLDARLTPIVVIAIPAHDPTLVTGTGFAGGTMTAEEYDQMAADQRAEGERVAREAAVALGLAEAEIRVVRGAAGPAICELAAELGAAAVVCGTRGRGGFRRAVLGSVSDIIVRQAPCPVIVTSPAGVEESA